MSFNTIPKTNVTYQKQSQKGYNYQIFYFELACYRIHTTSSGPLSFCHSTQKGNLGRDNCQCSGALSKAHLPIPFPGCTGVAIINLDFLRFRVKRGGGGGGPQGSWRSTVRSTLISLSLASAGNCPWSISPRLA